METNKVKTCYRLFMAWQEDKETNWLEAMSRQGWHLAAVKYIQYIFIKGEPKEYIYRLDYKLDREIDFNEYVSIFRDAGWEYVTSLNHWRYFRAEPDKVAASDIYTSNESKAQKYRSILKILLVACWPSFYFAFVWFPIFGTRSAPHSQALEIIQAVCFVVALIMIYSIFRVALILRKLKKSSSE